MEFKCDKCGHLSIGDKPGAKEGCWMPDPADPKQLCRGSVRPVSESPGFEYKCTYCDYRQIYSGLDPSHHPTCPRPTGPGEGFIACGRPMEKVGPAPKTLRFRRLSTVPLGPVTDLVPSLAERYPQYYKDVRHLEYIDVYQIHQLYQIDDPSGCLQHADKKILLSGVRTGGKPKRKDIEEARDTLTRWLEITENGGNN